VALATPPKQSCMFFRATWRIFQMYPLNEQLSIKTPIWELGGYAMDAIGRHAGQCTVRSWIFDHLPVKWREVFEFPRPDPCLTCPPVDLIEHASIGDTMREFLVLTARTRDLEKLDEASIAQSFATGARYGLKQAADLYQRSHAKTRDIPKQLAALAADFPSPQRFTDMPGDSRTAPKPKARARRATKKKRRSQKR